MTTSVLMIGNSDGIGLATTQRLLAYGWRVTGVSRSESPINHASYKHHTVDVTNNEFDKRLENILREGIPDLFVYAAGIGELIDLTAMKNERLVIDVNLVGMVRAVSRITPEMVRRGTGHIIGISSLADDLLSGEAPSYHASKAGFSNYLGGLAIALRPHGVYVTNVRFGFVDTKMAKGDAKPFMMTVQKAVDHLEHCIEKKPTVYTAPKIAVPLVKFRKWMINLAK